MVQLVIGIVVFVAAIAGLWFSLPVDGKMRPFAQGGRDTYIAIAVTTSIGLSASLIIAGAVALANQ